MSSYLKGSMTVEACFVLPFFLFAFLNLISIIDIYRLQGSMSASMHSSARQMAIMAYEYNEIHDDSGYMESMGLSYGIAGTNAQNDLDNIYPNDTSWFMSKVMVNDDYIDLVATYTVSPPISLMGYGNRNMYNRLRTRAWTGYDNANVYHGADGDEEIVYVAETGTVYHRSRACTYIKLSIAPIEYSSVDERRNLDGGRYTPCEKCGSKSIFGNVYITDYGDRYHTTFTCSKLKRTITAIPISKVGNKGPCSRCGGK